MFPINGPGHQNNTFTEGDPLNNVPATRITDDWLNAVQAEILGVLSHPSANITPSASDNTQLRQAIVALIQALAPGGGGLSAGDFATKAQAEAGTNTTKVMSPKRTAEAIAALGLGATFEVASEAAMLALSAKKGDVAVRSDIASTFKLAALPAATLANWKSLTFSQNNYPDTVYLGAGQGFSTLHQILQLPLAQLNAIKNIVLTDTSYPDDAISLRTDTQSVTMSDLSHIRVTQQNNQPVDCHAQTFVANKNISSPIFDFDISDVGAAAYIGALFTALDSAKITVAKNRTLSIINELLYVAGNGHIDMPNCTINMIGDRAWTVSRSIALNFLKAGTVNITGSSITHSGSYTINRSNTAFANIKHLKASGATFTRLGTFEASNMDFVDLRGATFIDTPIYIDAGVAQLQGCAISFPTTNPATPLELKGSVYLTNATGDFGSLTLNTPGANGIIYG